MPPHVADQTLSIFLLILLYFVFLTDRYASDAVACAFLTAMPQGCAKDQYARLCLLTFGTHYIHIQL